jgi:hypothetical protein
MANRVLLGKRGSDYGLFVSKPTKDVTSADRKDLIFDSTDLRTSTVHAIKEITISSGTGSVNLNSDGSSMGFIPYVLWTQISGNNILGQTGHFSWSFDGGQATFSYGTDFAAHVSNTSITITRTLNSGYASGTFKFLVFNIPAE